jgi:hypothetical protein
LWHAPYLQVSHLFRNRFRAHSAFLQRTKPLSRTSPLHQADSRVSAAFADFDVSGFNLVRSGGLTVERVYGRLKDEFGGRMIRVRGPKKVMAHLMFGLLALTADQLLRLVS